MQKIIIDPKHGFSLNKAVMNDLFERRPELFDTPFEVEDFRVLEQSDEETASHYWNAVLRGTQLHFLQKTKEARIDPVLIARMEAGEFVGSEDSPNLKIVEIPDGVDWYVFEDEDGSETVHEKHRSWS